jgi:hypothetical protein
MGGVVAFIGGSMGPSSAWDAEGERASCGNLPIGAAAERIAAFWRWGTMWSNVAASYGIRKRRIRMVDDSRLEIELELEDPRDVLRATVFRSSDHECAFVLYGAPDTNRSVREQLVEELRARGFRKRRGKEQVYHHPRIKDYEVKLDRHEMKIHQLGPHGDPRSYASFGLRIEVDRAVAALDELLVTQVGRPPRSGI